MTCPRCGTDNDTHLIPVWQDEADNTVGNRPDFVGCTNCHYMHRPDLLECLEEDDPPQAKLTDHEVHRLRIGNQHSRDLSIIEWQCVKGAANYYGVSDWTSKADSTLTKDENIGLMERHGSENKTTSLRHLNTPAQGEG